MARVDSYCCQRPHQGRERFQAEPNIKMLLFIILGLGGLYFVLTSLYRLYFHPLRRFPGPKLAAITHGYEFYHDVFCRGMYLWEIEKMHKKYGKQDQ